MALWATGLWAEGLWAAGLWADDATAPTVTTTTLSAGQVGVAYSATLAASGTAPITWAVTVGSLPAGLELSTTGAITGTPTVDGSYEFTVEATNSEGSDTQALTLLIAEATASGGVLVRPPSRDDLKKFKDLLSRRPEHKGKGRIRLKRAVVSGEGSITRASRSVFNAEEAARVADAVSRPVLRLPKKKAKVDLDALIAAEMAASEAARRKHAAEVAAIAKAKKDRRRKQDEEILLLL